MKDLSPYDIERLRFLKCVNDPTEERKQKAIEFVGKKYGVDRDQATEFVNRKRDWTVIRSFRHKGNFRECEICRGKNKGGYWCKPCIHPMWCCECCILIGTPEYATGVAIMAGDGIRVLDLSVNKPCDTSKLIKG